MVVDSERSLLAQHTSFGFVRVCMCVERMTRFSDETLDFQIFKKNLFSFRYQKKC